MNKKRHVPVLKPKYNRKGNWDRSLQHFKYLFFMKTNEIDKINKIHIKYYRLKNLSVIHDIGPIMQ